MVKRVVLILCALTGLSLPVAAQEPRIQPHRAIYQVSLSKVKGASAVQDVSGTMVYELTDTCDGWAAQQQMQMHFAFPEGDSSDVMSSVLTWEAKDGSAFRFNVRRVTDGREDANFKGVVSSTDKGRIAHYALPKDKPDYVLEAQDMFPTAHTLMLLKKALASEKFVSRRVFDGSDEEGAVDTSAFLGPVTPVQREIDHSKDNKETVLLSAENVKMRIAFYKPGDQTGEPDYEMELDLRGNGIADSMMIDYGDFAITGKLAELAPVEESACQGTP